jgi:hypothetical protein
MDKKAAVDTTAREHAKEEQMQFSSSPVDGVLGVEPRRRARRRTMRRHPEILIRVAISQTGHRAISPVA